MKDLKTYINESFLTEEVLYDFVPEGCTVEEEAEYLYKLAKMAWTTGSKDRYTDRYGWANATLYGQSNWCRCGRLIKALFPDEKETYRYISFSYRISSSTKKGHEPSYSGYVYVNLADYPNEPYSNRNPRTSRVIFKADDINPKTSGDFKKHLLKLLKNAKIEDLKKIF